MGSKTEQSPRRDSTVLRPLDTPEAKAAFWPLFEQRNAVMEEQGTVTEAMFAAIKRKDEPARQLHAEKLEELKLREEALSREMRAHQTR